MKKQVLLLLLALIPASAQASFPTCNPLTILPNTLAYVSSAYGINPGTCFESFGFWACPYYPGGPLAALVTVTNPQVKKTCATTYSWYNCPLNGNPCLVAAHVTCGGWSDKNWREQCSQTP